MMIRKDAKRNKRSFKWFTIIILILVLFFIVNTKIYNKLSGFFHGIAYPFWKVHNNVWVIGNNISLVFKSKQSLENQIKDLQSENLELKTKQSLFNNLENENKTLKETMGRFGGKDFIIAGVLSWPYQSIYDVITIDAGLNEGIEVGKRVYVYGTVLLGEVSEVYKNSSKVLLYSTFEKKVSGVVENTNTPVDLVGLGGGSFEILLPKDVVVDIGSKIIVPGIGSYIYAEAEKKISDVRNPIDKIIAVTPVNINSIRFVEVEK